MRRLYAGSNRPQNDALPPDRPRLKLNYEIRIFDLSTRGVEARQLKQQGSKTTIAIRTLTDGL